MKEKKKKENPTYFNEAININALLTPCGAFRDNETKYNVTKQNTVKSSLRGWRSKGKGKGVGARDRARGRRESAPRALARPNSPFPFYACHATGGHFVCACVNMSCWSASVTEFAGCFLELNDVYWMLRCTNVFFNVSWYFYGLTAEYPATYLNMNSSYCYIPRSSKHTDTCT